MKITDGRIIRSYKATTSSSGIVECFLGDRRYYRGCVLTQFGFVQVYAETDFYNLQVVANGEVYEMGQSTNCLITPTGLARQAGKFAKSVFLSDEV